MADGGADRPPTPARVRVTAPRQPPSLPDLGSDAGVHTAPAAESVYLGGLFRTQLRLGLGHAIGCCLSIGVIAVAAAFLPALQTSTFLGVPWSWLVQAYVPYPVVAVFAVSYARSAARHEQRYQSLRGQE